LVLLSVSFAASGAARTDYVLNCQGCHVADGSGMPPEVPRLTDNVGYYLQVEGGREYLVQVPGAANSLLSDAALADVINWMLRDFAGRSLPTEFVPFSADEVTKARASRPLDVSAMRAALIERIRARFPEATF
jgi:mono/diheme cytochrome c family protein